MLLAWFLLRISTFFFIMQCALLIRYIIDFKRWHFWDKKIHSVLFSLCLVHTRCCEILNSPLVRLINILSCAPCPLLNDCTSKFPFEWAAGRGAVAVWSMAPVWFREKLTIHDVGCCIVWNTNFGILGLTQPLRSYYLLVQVARV
jgi:hypothetical protein